MFYHMIIFIGTTQGWLFDLWANQNMRSEITLLTDTTTKWLSNKLKKRFTYCMFWYCGALTHAEIDQSIRPIHLQAARNKENEKQWWVYTPQWCYDRFISVQISKTGYLKNYLNCLKVFTIRKSEIYLFENYKDGWVRR